MRYEHEREPILLAGTAWDRNARQTSRGLGRPLQVKMVLHPATQLHGLGDTLDGDQVGCQPIMHVLRCAMSWTL